ncbi:MobV family relaxase [Aureimonas psammosilenae]|uniref:MobV family relaxase n=1 Tax=Aureimonas psammosilenae TaxID=2495496 RepID=UPI001260E495|nr:MobV family relaxase [Aureimonas psammosilenae]
MASTVCHADKVKTPVHLINLIRHNSRSAPPANADAKRSPSNRSWEDAGAHPWDTIASRIETAGIDLKRVRKDAVRGVHLNLSASPDYFRPGRPEAAGDYDEDRLESWVEASRRWLEQTYGDRLVDCRLHLDEATPHIQAVYVPLTPDGRLSAKEMLDRAALTRMQDTYAEAVAHLGIERGVRGSKAKHESIGAYYARVERAFSAPIELAAEIEPPRLTDIANAKGYQKRQQARIETAAAPMAAAASQAVQERRKRQGLQRRVKEADRRLLEAQKEKQAALRERDQARKAEQIFRLEARQYATQANQLQADLEEARTKREAQDRDELDRLRTLNLEQLAPHLGLSQDPDDATQWLSETARVTIKGAKFFDHVRHKGGGGAIDFVAFGLGVPPGRAISWLREFDPSLTRVALRQMETQAKASPPRPVFVRRDHHEGMWPRVRRWLTSVRKLSGELVDRLRASDRIAADERGNFLARMFDAEGREVGAEVKGTDPHHRFTGLQRGTSRLGAFTIETQPGRTYAKGLRYKQIAIVESAADAIAYLETHPELMEEPCLVISTAGTRASLDDHFVDAMARQRTVLMQTPSLFRIAFDADPAGDTAAEKLKQWLLAQPRDVWGSVVRDRPKDAKDWNDTLITGQKPTLLEREKDANLDEPDDDPSPSPGF